MKATRVNKQTANKKSWLCVVLIKQNLIFPIIDGISPLAICFVRKIWEYKQKFLYITLILSAGKNDENWKTNECVGINRIAISLFLQFSESFFFL